MYVVEGHLLRPARRTSLATTLATLAALVLGGCGSDADNAEATSKQTVVSTTPTTDPPATVAAPTTDAVATTEEATTTQAPTTTVSAGPKKLPPITVKPGTYIVDKFVLPFDVTVTANWTRQANTEKFFWIGRGAYGAELLVTSGVVDGATPQEVLDQFCAAAGRTGEVRTDTTLFGQPAVQLEASVTSECTAPGHVGTETTDWFIQTGGTFRVIAADVGGTLVVAAADSSAETWAATSVEIDAVLGSLTLVS